MKMAGRMYAEKVAKAIKKMQQGGTLMEILKKAGVIRHSRY